MKSIPEGIKLNIIQVTKLQLKEMIKKFRYIPFVGGNRPLPDELEWEPEEDEEEINET
jgi:hypothetical protein